MKTNYLKHIIISLLAIVALSASAQTTNNTFKAGELLEYDLYFKYKISLGKVGKSSLSLKSASINGTSGYKATMLAKTSGAARMFLSLDDTITSTMTTAIVPMAYTKDAHEKGDHTIERASYTYTGNNTKVHVVNNRNGKQRYDLIHEATGGVYDMVSIIYYARTLDFSNAKKGDKKAVNFFSGRTKGAMNIVYQGTEKIKANDGNHYNCIKLSMILQDDAFVSSEAMKVWLSNDANKIPVKIDSKLKVGSTQVVLKKFKGLKN